MAALTVAALFTVSGRPYDGISFRSYSAGSSLVVLRCGRRSDAHRAHLAAG
ncbi:hypothetical protein ACQE98_07745 [Ornithinimicrobium sp. W1679]|uniref:hypothetical protein n=1 Tax=Ornithinimicrobium sp. W1679 TaxID=3418770 RepID=UPI003CEB2DF5